MTAEGDNWYSYELEETATSNIIFNNGNGQQTPDLSRSSGEWWYKDNTWYDSKPTTETGGGGSTGGTLSIGSCGKGNMRIYVLSLPNNVAPGKIGEDGAYLKQ